MTHPLLYCATPTAIFLLQSSCKYIAMHCNSYDELANHRAVFKVNDIVCNQSADRGGEKMHCGRYDKN